MFYQGTVREPGDRESLAGGRYNSRTNNGPNPGHNRRGWPGGDTQRVTDGDTRERNSTLRRHHYRRRSQELQVNTPNMLHYVRFVTYGKGDRYVIIIYLFFQSRMARTHSRAIGRRQNALHVAAPGLRIGSSIHPERNSRLDRHRIQRSRRFRPLLAPTRRNIQVRVRQENRPRGRFTIESGVQHQSGNLISLSGLGNITWYKVYFLYKVI